MSLSNGEKESEVQRYMMIEGFLNYLRFESNRSELTVKSYGDDLKAFEAFFQSLDKHITWETVDADVVRDWMEHMMDAGNAATSVNRRLSAVRSFYRYAQRRGLIDKDPAHGVDGPKKKKPLPQFVKESEMDRLLELMADGTEYKEVCARTIILLFYETGVRLSELVGLDDLSVDFQNKQLKVTGKRNKQRIIPFGEDLDEALRKYITLRDAQVTRQDDALFVTPKGERMKDAQVRREVKENLAKVCTLKKKSPHVLRHTFATAMLNHEAGLESVKKLLGHASLSTTEIYTHTTFEQLKKEYANAHPRA